MLPEANSRFQFEIILFLKGLQYRALNQQKQL